MENMKTNTNETKLTKKEINSVSRTLDHGFADHMEL